MKKTNKKQIPKVRLPKYGDGGASVVSEKRTKNMYGNEPGTGMSTGQKTAIAGAALQGGMEAVDVSQQKGLSAYEKNQKYGNAIKSTETGVVSAINPVFGMIHGAVTMATKPLTAKATQTDEQGNLKNRKFAKADIIGQGFADPMAMIPTMIDNKFSMKNYLNQVEDSAKGKIADQKAQEDAYAQQQNAAQEQQNAYIQNAVQQGIAANNQGGGNNIIQYNKYGGQMKFAMGGMQYANGGTGQINSEVEGGGYNEDGENAVAPNGEFTQFNGPTHAQGGIQTDMAPGTRIFSAKLNPVGSKKSFAKLNESNNTNREDKLEAKGNLDPKSKTSIDLTRMAKMKNSDMLFAMQEQLKKDKVAAYAKKMGVELPLMDNEQMEPQGMSEQSEGEMPMARYGGRFALGGVQLPYYNTDRNGNPKYGMGGFNDDPTLTPATTSTVAPTPVKLPTDGKLPTDFKSFNEFDTYMKSQPGLYAPNPQTLGKNLTYYPKNKYSYNKDTNIWSHIDGSPVEFNSPLSSDLIGFTPKSTATPTPTANWRTNQLLKGGGNILTFPNGDTQIVAPKKVHAYGGKMPKYSLAGTTPIIMQDNGAPSIVPTSPDGSMANTESSFKLDSNAIGDKDNNFQWNYVNGKYIQPDSHTSYNLKVPKKPKGPEKPPFNWKDTLSQVANFAAQNAGNIYNLSRYNKPEIETYERAKASYLDNTAAMRDAEQEARRDEYAVRGASGGNAGTYLANRVGLNTAKVMNKDRIRQQYANANAQIGNQNAQFNTDIAMREVIANAQNRARNRSGKGEAIGDIGQNFGVASKAGKQGEMDQKTLALIMKYYNTPEFQKMMKDNKFT
jgi:hypothetical protein